MSEIVEELVAIAGTIERGEDSYQVPEEMLVEPEPEKPVNKSLYMKILTMPVGEKIKLALKGNREARVILLRDANRMIPRFVLKNPRITDEELIMIARNRNADSDILREIGDHKTWPRNYQVRLALVMNPKTPMAISVHFVTQLAERDMRHLAKSKNVSSTVVSHARRLLIMRGKM